VRKTRLLVSDAVATEEEAAIEGFKAAETGMYTKKNRYK
jgi:hypothetical protein